MTYRRERAGNYRYWQLLNQKSKGKGKKMREEEGKVKKKEKKERGPSNFFQP